MIAIIDYGIGNLGSISNLFKKIGVHAEIHSDPEKMQSATHYVFPGVGHFDQGMKNLEERNLIPFLNQKALAEKKPFLGICLGAQLMTQKSEEGLKPGLGWFSATTKRFAFEPGAKLKIPHMGWNELIESTSHVILNNFDSSPRFYFVHSYFMECSNAQDIIAKTHYGVSFCSILGRDNIVGVQFHPEKSHKFGMQLFRNFSQWDGK